MAGRRLRSGRPSAPSTRLLLLLLAALCLLLSLKPLHCTLFRLVHLPARSRGPLSRDAHLPPALHGGAEMSRTDNGQHGF